MCSFRQTQYKSFGSNHNNMVRLINLSPISIFVALAVLAKITEAEDCELKCTPTEYYTEYGKENATELIVKDWHPNNCEKNVTVTSVGETYYLQGLDSQHFIFKDVVYLDNCDDTCYRADCITATRGFYQSIAACGIHKSKECN